LDIKVGYLPGIPDRVMVNPEGSPVKGGHMGTKLAFGPAEDRSPDKPLLGGEEKRLPVGFPGGADPENQGGIGKTAVHSSLYQKSSGDTWGFPKASVFEESRLWAAFPEHFIKPTGFWEMRPCYDITESLSSNSNNYEKYLFLCFF
jgi:hypothetical protein